MIRAGNREYFSNFIALPQLRKIYTVKKSETVASRGVEMVSECVVGANKFHKYL